MDDTPRTRSTAAVASPDAMCAKTSESPFGRDPHFVTRVLRLTNLAMRYFSPAVCGLENVPESGPALVVGNHSGLMYLPDFWIALDAITRRRGPELPVHLLAYDLLMMTPGLKSLLRQLGAIPASPENAERALGMGDLVMAYPGGDWEACRPYGDRNRIDFHDHKGFVRLALRCGVPVIPVVSHGAQHALFVLSRGDRVARRLHVPNSPLRVNVLPVVFAPPFGIALAPSPYPPPMPAAVTVQFLPALNWSALDAGAAKDPTVVNACYAETVATMQAALDRLNADRPHPVLSGSHQLLQGIGHAAVRALGQVIQTPRSTAQDPGGSSLSKTSRLPTQT